MFIFENPEVKKLFEILTEKLLDESGRGALLIATAHADEYLTELIEEVFPKEFSKNNRDRLLKYPGPLSSFSSKIELAYAFRLIPKHLYDSLNALRKLRNDAAHSSSSFELHELGERLKPIYELGPSMPIHIKNLSTELLVIYKMSVFKEIIKDSNSNISKEEERDILSAFLNNKANVKLIENQVPFWELIVALCSICAILIYQKNNILKLTQDISIWSDLLREETDTQDDSQQ